MWSILVMSFAAPAIACSCLPGVEATIPGLGAAGVPLDAALRVAWDDEGVSGYRLVDELTGEELALSVDEWTEGRVVWQELVPVAPLAPDTAYQVVADGDLYGLVEMDVLRFATGRIETDDAPPEVSITSLSSKSASSPFGQSSCGISRAVWGELAIATHDAPIGVEVEVSREKDFAAADRVTVEESEFLWVGSDMCTTNLATLENGARAWVRARAVTLSGVAGPWSEAEAVHVGGAFRCGYAPFGPGWLVLLALGALTSRRPRASEARRQLPSG